jgi:hypothetical protein
VKKNRTKARPFRQRNSNRNKKFLYFSFHSEWGKLNASHRRIVCDQQYV